jgi:hypothetical protein
MPETLKIKVKEMFPEIDFLKIDDLDKTPKTPKPRVKKPKKDLPKLECTEETSDSSV